MSHVEARSCHEAKRHIGHVVVALCCHGTAVSGCVGSGELDRHCGKRNLLLDNVDDKDAADYANGQ